MRPVLLSLPFLLSFVACASHGDGLREGRTVTHDIEEASEDLLAPLAQGANSAIQETRVVVLRGRAAWAELWAEHTANVLPAPPLPEVDFEHEMVVAAFLGQRSSGGYAVSLGDAHRVGARLRLTAREERPGPDVITTMALTSPFAIVTVPRRVGAVEVGLQ